MTSATEQRLLFPGLAGFYASWRDITYTLVRVVIGYILLMHGWVKVNTGIAGVAGFMAKIGLEPSRFFGGAAMFLETVGAIRIILGLFTRFFCRCARHRAQHRVCFRAHAKGFRRGARRLRICAAVGSRSARDRHPRRPPVLDRPCHRQGTISFGAARADKRKRSVGRGDAAIRRRSRLPILPRSCR